MNRALALLLVGGCGGEASAPDAGADAREVTFPTCEPTFEGMWYQTVVEFLPVDQGRDIDGDGDVDNLVGSQRDLLNPLLAARIADGSLIAVFGLPGLSLTPTTSANEIDAYWPLAADADADPTNNLVDRRFLVSLSVFDASCTPRSPMRVVQTGLAYHAESDGGPFAGQIGLFNLQRAVYDGEVDPAGSLQTYVSGAYPACPLSRAAAGGDLPGSTLDALVALQLQPDIDLDGDGLERLERSGVAIDRCIDGDGTVIEGSACPCAPAITDAFSAAVRFDAIPADVVGTIP